jgi:glycopeptide antibiotics resistance protein
MDHMDKVLKVLYFIYFVILFAVITCKLQDMCYSIPEGKYFLPAFRSLYEQRRRAINLVPFQAYRYWFSLGIDASLIKNILGNTVAFMPMGFFEMALSNNRKIWKVVLKCFIIVIALETFQLVSCLGYFDIDDITMNTFGCLLGALSYYVLY